MATSNNNPACPPPSSRPPSRPTTPLRRRRPSRDSLRAASLSSSLTHPLAHPFPLDTLESTFAELADSLTDLHTNLMHLQLMHESMSRFNESFSAFLYGLNVNAFCVDFPEVGFSRFLSSFLSLSLSLSNTHTHTHTHRRPSPNHSNSPSGTKPHMPPPPQQQE